MAEEENTVPEMNGNGVNDEFLINLIMVLVHKLGGEVRITNDNIQEVVNGENALRMRLEDDESAITLRVDDEAEEEDEADDYE